MWSANDDCGAFCVVARSLRKKAGVDGESSIDIVFLIHLRLRSICVVTQLTAFLHNVFLLALCFLHLGAAELAVN